ncbi:MAG: alpha-glucosidase C-terminal domain-containing protein [Elusimicrobia bacterium]|nr:alpha-glucosidase C-terminal domain-containing protein [Elusimicrobiota bacterium]
MKILTKRLRFETKWAFLRHGLLVPAFLSLAVPPSPGWAKAELGRASAEGAEVMFSFSPPIAVASASVAGSFDGWNKDAHPLTDPDHDGVYTFKLPLPWGRHLYKFVVEGREWKADPENPVREPDGFDGFNSVVIVGNPGPKASRRDGKIDAAALLHGPGIGFRERVPSEGLAILRLRAAQDDLQAARIVFDTFRTLEMERVYDKDGFSIWEAAFPAGQRPIRYAFMAEDGREALYLGVSGASRAMPPPQGLFAFDRSAPSLAVPSWVADAVFYQIFPERFADGDPRNNPPGAQAWGAAPTIHNHFGGDLDGIVSKLPYLKDLGINAIYLNPIFKAPSSHKYDTADYMAVDPAFGGSAAFDRLVAAARKHGIRLVLDGVFNHSGDRFWAFQDVMKNGAKSAYASWYTVRSFPVVQDPPNYECWWGFGHLPKLNTGHPAARQYLLKVGAHWLGRGVSGWRLDVPNEVPHPFWKEFRKRARKAAPQAYIVGEIWEDGLPWLGGDEFDAVMNYPFRKAVLDFFGPKAGSLQEFHQALLETRHRYPRSALPAQFNLVGSHDTPRFATALEDHRAAQKLAVLFQMTYLGAPVVYYGDEVGLPGEKDPDCRRCFPWDPDAQDRNLREHYRKLIRIRRSRPGLRRGSFEVLLADERKGVYAFMRRYKKDASLVVLHRGDGEAEVSLDLPAPLRAPMLRDLYEGGVYLTAGGKIGFMLGPWQGAILGP